MIGAFVKFQDYNPKTEQTGEIVSFGQGFEELQDGVGNYTSVLIKRENNTFISIIQCQILQIIPVQLTKVEWGRGQFGNVEYGSYTDCNLAIVGKHIGEAGRGEQKENGIVLKIEKWNDSKIVIHFDTGKTLELINIPFEASK